jgi:uncharacterized membrane protein
MAANAPTAKGLQITPVRDDIKVDAGKKTYGSLVVANLTDRPLTVNLSTKVFAVTAVTYDYRFSDAKKPWIHLGETEIVLASGQSRTIPYSVTPDAQSTPGGYYYTVIASTKVTSGGLPSTIQAALLLYITIKGKLVETGQIQNINAPRLVFGKKFNVSVDALNTGNVYYFASVQAHVKGASTNQASVASSHLLIPNKMRRISSSISSPVFPGIYPLEVTYASDNGTVAHASHLVVFIPPWFVAVLIGMLLIGNVVRKRSRGTRPAPHTDTTESS